MFNAEILRSEELVVMLDEMEGYCDIHFMYFLPEHTLVSKLSWTRSVDYTGVNE